MCKQCNPKKNDSPYIPFEVYEHGSRYFLTGFYFTRIGVCAQYSSHADFYLRNGFYEVNKLYKYDSEHKKVILPLLDIPSQNKKYDC